MLNQIYIHYINTLFVLESFIISCWLLKGKKIGIGIGIGQFARKKSVSESATKNHDRCITNFSPSPLRTQSIHAALHRTTDIKPWICYFPLCLSLTPFTQHVGSGKLLECLLCERKHVPGFIPGSIPGWGPSNIAGFSPGTSFV